jgi:hypothetical protein
MFMIGRIGLAVCAMTLFALTAVLAQQVVTGTVLRVDQPARVIVLDNGQMYQMTPESVVLVNGQPMAIATVAPGTPVVLQSAPGVVYRDGRYVVMTQAVANLRGQRRGALRGDADRARTRVADARGRRDVWIDENTQVLANGSPVMLSTLKPATFVVVRSTRPLAFHGDQSRTVVAAGEVVVTSPSGLPATVYGAASPSVISAPTSPEMGLRERELERQAP